MKKFCLIFIIIVSLLPVVSAANPPCPQTANHLEDFAYCMHPFPNGKGHRPTGQVLNGASMEQMDHHTAALMSSLNAMPAPPQFINAVYPYSTTFYVYVPYKYRASNVWGGLYWQVGWPIY